MFLYTWCMSVQFDKVLPTSQMRTEIHAALERFRTDGITAMPVVFGSHRKPEAVLIPYELYDKLASAVEDLLLAELIRIRLSGPKSDQSFEELVEELGFKMSDFE